MKWPDISLTHSRTLLIGLLLASCSGNGNDPSKVLQSPPVARVQLEPATLVLSPGTTGQLTATAFDDSGNALSGRSLSYATSSASVATVSTSGLVTAVSAGTASITVTSEGKSAATQITVTNQSTTVQRVAVTPATVSVAVGGAVQLTAVAYDAQNRQVSDQIIFSSTNTAVASVAQSGVVTGVAAGNATIGVSAGGVAVTVPVTVTPVVLAQNVIDVDPGVTHQTITGWQALTQNGWLECNSTAFGIYKNTLHDRAATELGINRMTIMLRSGTENTRDYYAEFVNGQIDVSQWRNFWYVPVNDNADPNVADPARFFWGYIDGQIENAIIPMQQRLSARGERLYVVLQYVDFTLGNNNKPFLPMANPAEYAELVVETFKHLRQKYNLVPDAFEMVLEPEHTPYSASDIGRAVVAVVSRLRSSGFDPAIIAPSTTSMLNAHVWYDQMLQTPGISGLITELAYHRYVAVSNTSLQAIGQRTTRDGIKTSMLEHIDSGFDDLYDDLTVGMVSSWQQFALAFCSQVDNAESGGVYYRINQSNPSSPRILFTNRAKLLRQVFAYVRLHAVRVGATSTNASDVRPLAFRNTNGKFVTVVWARNGATTFSVRGLPAGTYGVNWSNTGTQVNVDLPNQTISAGGVVTATIPSAGVITIYGR